MKKNLLKISLFALLAIALTISCMCGKKKESVPELKKIVILDSLRYIKPVFDSVDVKKDIVFSEVINYKDSLEKLHLDVYTPFGDNENNRPVILWVHGGGFSSGTKTQNYITTLAMTFARKGYVSISTDYRLRKDPGENMSDAINDAVNDVMAALKWIRENSLNYGINKDYIIVGGGSAGGILSTNLCYKDSSDTETWDKSGLIAFINLWGSPNMDMMDKTVDRNDPPTIFVHGIADSIVPYSNCLWLSCLLDQQNVRYEIFAIEGAGHTPVAHMNDIEAKISMFLYKILTENKNCN
jgi:dipeptidyl aminopeptidase/acylaminoacyl peptidase